MNTFDITTEEYIKIGALIAALVEKDMLPTSANWEIIGKKCLLKGLDLKNK